MSLQFAVSTRNARLDAIETDRRHVSHAGDSNRCSTLLTVRRRTPGPSLRLGVAVRFHGGGVGVVRKQRVGTWSSRSCRCGRGGSLSDEDQRCVCASCKAPCGQGIGRSVTRQHEHRRGSDSYCDGVHDY
jgi:hypothetical protein